MNRPYKIFHLSFIFIFLLLFNENSKGQVLNQDAFFELNSTIPGDQTYEARDYVKLKPDFAYTPYTTNAFLAKINNGVVIPLSQDITSTTQTSISGHTLETDLAVGTTPGVFNVSLWGAATYSVPISLPPGTAGMVPSLSVNYNSNAGEGIMGEGWNIDGLSAIYRVNKSIDPDGINEEPQFSSTDAFALDGNRLVYAYGTFSQYRTSVETFTLITITSTNSYGPTAFTAETKDGLIIEYGNTTDSKVSLSSDIDKVKAYYINKVTDKFGNYYSYKYKNDNSTGEFRIEEIDYTANDDLGIAPYNKVYFVYETKPADFIDNKYDLGSMIADNVLLREIRISCEGSIFHKYVFNYTDNAIGDAKYVHLTDIQEFGSDGTAYNKTIFNWGTTNSDMAVAWGGYPDYNSNDPNFFSETFSGDFNGDGKTEDARITRRCRAIFYTGEGHPENDCGGTDVYWDYYARIYASWTGGTECVLSTAKPDDSYTYYMGEKPSSYATGGIADINGDGKDDALYLENQHLSNTGNRIFYFIPLITTISNNDLYFTNDLDDKIRYPEGTGSVDEATDIENELADFNGDGLADLLIYDKTLNNLLIYYTTNDAGNITPFAEKVDFSSIIPQNGDAMTFLDYNGDRIIDFIIDQTLYVGYVNDISNGDVGFDTYSIPFGGYRMYPADFNNDGKTDIWFPNESKIYFSTGKQGGFISKEITEQKHTNSSIDNAKYYIGDYNGDGKVDIAYYSSYYISGYCMYQGYFGIWFNENFYADKCSFQYWDCNDITNNQSGVGEGLMMLCYSYNSNGGCSQGSYLNDNSIFQGAYAVDEDGDGASEIRFITKNYDAQIDEPNHQTKEIYLTSNILKGTNKFNNKLTGISNGLNAKTFITYSAGETGLGIGAEFPAVDCVPTVPVVKEYSVSDGIGNTTSFEYTYSGAKAHLRGKGFLGFSNVTEKHDLSEVGSTTSYAETIKSYRFDNPYYYPWLNTETLNYVVDLPVTESPDQYFSYTITNNIYSTDFFDYSNGHNTDHFFPFLNYESSTQYNYPDLSLQGYTNLWNDLTSTGVPVTTETNYNYPEQNGTDSYGNISSIVTTKDPSTSEASFDNYETKGSWCPNKPESQTISQTRTGDNIHSVTIDYDWDNTTGKLLSQESAPGAGDENITTPSTDQSVLTEYDYTPAGNLFQTTVTGSDVVDPEVTLLEFDAKERFIIKTTNAEGHIVQASYEPRYGNIIKSIDENGLTTTFKYDGFGRMKESTLPTGKKVTKSYEWIQTSNKLFSSTVTAEDASPVISYFDCLGREIGNETYGYGNKVIYTTTYYNRFGQIAQVRKPSPNTNRIITQNSFDLFGRLRFIYNYSEAQSVDPSGYTDPSTSYVEKINYSYTVDKPSSKVSVSVVDDNQRSMTKTLINGEVVSVTDATSNDVSYTYNSSNQPVEITSNGATTTIVYDKYGRQQQLIDPDAGTSTYEYNSLNQLTKQTDNKGNIYEFEYDKLGRVVKKEETPTGSITKNTYNYTYDTETHGKGKIASMSGGPDNMTTTYKYDNLSRNYNVTENFDGQSFSTTYGYDSHSRVNRITYPSGFIVNQTYDDLSNNLIEITDASNNRIWELTSINNIGTPSATTLGANGEFVTENNLTDLGLPDNNSFTATIGSDTWSNQWIYDFNTITGNMDSRQNILTQSGFSSITPRNLTETFTYDDLDRLLTASPGSQLTMEMTYNESGTIATKTDALGNEQTYTYNTTPNTIPIHAVQSISPLNETLNPSQEIAYTPFNKIETIKEGDITLSTDYIQLDYTYGLDNERRKMVLQKYTGGDLDYTKTKYFSMNYEKENITTGGNTVSREINYIFAPDGLAAIYEKKSGIGKMYYVSTDILGSINMIVNTDGTLESDLSYDAWGRRRNAQDWSYESINTSGVTDRGYTMHEHLDEYNLINMNGRVYDPIVGQFLSPDPFIQSPGYTQSYNHYAYCINNPLKYTDPSGYNYYIDGLLVYGDPSDYLNNPKYWSSISSISGAGNGMAFNYDFTKLPSIKYYQYKKAYGFWVDKKNSSVGSADYYTTTTEGLLFGQGSTYNVASKWFSVDDIVNHAKESVKDVENTNESKSISDGIKNTHELSFLIGYQSTFVGLCLGNSKEASFLTKISGRVGQTAGLINLGLSYYIAKSDGHLSWGDKARLAVAGTTYIGTNYFTSPWVIVPSLVVSVIDVAGGMDNWYNEWDKAEKMYNDVGVAIPPISFLNNGIPFVITKK